MATESREGERVENTERAEGHAERVTPEQALRRGAEEVHRRLDAGDTFERAAHGLARELADGILERADFGREVISGVRARLAEHPDLLGEWGERLSEGLGKADSVLAEGSAWLREHPETIDAVVLLVCLALLAAFYPEQGMKLLRERPDLATKPLSTLLAGEPRVLATK